MGEPTRVLILEDEILIAWELRDALIDAGFQVVGTASRVREALPIAEKTHPHVAVVDVRLRGERDGIEAGLLLRQQFGAEIVFLTGQAEPVAEQRAGFVRPAAYLHKPVSHRLLVSTIREAAAIAPEQTVKSAV
jgi:two-component system, response regulator PdtaR